MPTTFRGSTLVTLRKGIDLLFLFSEAEASLSLPEIAARLKLPRSTAYRFVSTLREAGLLVRDAEARRYALGARLLNLQPAIARPIDLRTTALPFLRDLVHLSGETAHLAERRGPTGVIIEVVESPQALRMAPKRGESFPLHAGALSRAILAFLPPQDIEEILRGGNLKCFTANTPATPGAVRRLLREVRRKGYAVSFEEITPGACGMSAPILGRDGWAIASIGISAVMQRLTAEKRKALFEAVCDAAQKVSKLMRHQRG